jgi:site-specific DNA-methyltransferase (adenine-specific)
MKSVWYDVKWDESDVQVLFEMKPPARDEKTFGKHPTQKPLMLLERLISAASDKGDLVFDPFMGSGTTAVAAKNLGRKFVGCELDPNFISLAVKRIISAQKQRLASLFSE